MPDPDFTLPDPCSTRATKQAEFPSTVRSLLGADGYPLADHGLLAPLARNVGRALVEAGFTFYHCDRCDPLCWLGWVRLMLIPVESVTGRRAIGISWTTHDLLLDVDWRATHSHTCWLVNAVFGSFLYTFGYLDRQRGTRSACLVTSRRGQRTEAGR